MKCEKCGTEFPTGADFCPSCGQKLSTTTKTMDAVQDVGEKTVDVTKKVGKGALRITGKALSKLGEATEKAGKKIKKSGE